MLGIRFTDQLSGQSDELTVELEDSAGRWRGAWYPGKGDTLSLALGRVGTPLRPCGTFSIDEIELSGPPDTVSLRGLSASVTTALRTRSYRAFEQTSLAAIARRIAQKHHLTLEGQIAPLPLTGSRSNMKPTWLFCADWPRNTAISLKSRRAG
ncbi:hypothetical protein WH390_02055 [Candidatus Arsenophonus nilaparvatae]|uniref:phage late control D family protein n=1 Tax=Candidatus Arsenophonus nilaparvatae TaxID=1247023 RepID=UPI0038782F59